MSADGEERAVQEVISRLRFIAKLQAGEKIDVSSLTVQPAGLLGRLYRTFIARGETRVATFEFIRGVLGDAFSLAEARVRTPAGHEGARVRTPAGHMVADALAGARAGIVSLRETYRDDRMFVARVDTLLETLDTKIATFAVTAV